MNTMKAVSEYLASFAIGVIKDSAVERIDEVKLKNKLKHFIEEQKKYNEVCTLAEEFDFQGLVEYISDNLMETVKIRLCATNSKKRGRARQEIINAAVSYSGANTKESQRRVSRLVGCSLDIVRDFYRAKIPLTDYYLASEAVDSVKENTDESLEKAKEEVIQAVVHESEAIRHSNAKTYRELGELKKSLPTGSLFSIDQACDLMQKGQHSEVEKEINKFFEHISIDHPLFPEYGYGLENKKLKSIPRMDCATKLHPPRLRFTGEISADNYYFNDLKVDPFKYAYRHQTMLVLSVKEAIKLLGDVPDPIQDDAEELLGKKVILKPPVFPPAFPCSIKIGNQVFYDYILFRTQEILDDGTYIISNKEQTEAEIYFELQWKLRSSFICNPQENSSEAGNDGNALEEKTSIKIENDSVRVKSVDFKMQIRNVSHRGMLRYKKIMLELSRQGDLHIYSLEHQKDVFAGIINNFVPETGFASIEDEVDFLNRLCIVEEYFKVEFDLPEELSAQECQCIIQISDLIMKDQVDFTWEETEVTGVVSEYFKENLKNLKTPVAMFSYIGVTDVNIFGAKFSYNYMRTYKEAVIQNIDRILNLAEQLDNGDPLRIKFKPGEDKTGFDTMNIPDELLEGDE